MRCRAPATWLAKPSPRSSRPALKRLLTHRGAAAREYDPALDDWNRLHGSGPLSRAVESGGLARPPAEAHPPGNRCRRLALIGLGSRARDGTRGPDRFPRLALPGRECGFRAATQPAQVSRRQDVAHSPREGLAPPTRSPALPAGGTLLRRRERFAERRDGRLGRTRPAGRTGLRCGGLLAGPLAALPCAGREGQAVPGPAGGRERVLGQDVERCAGTGFRTLALNWTRRGGSLAPGTAFRKLHAGQSRVTSRAGQLKRSLGRKLKRAGGAVTRSTLPQEQVRLPRVASRVPGTALA